MTAPRIDVQLIRRLRDEAADDGRVVSVYLSLDPTTFSTPEARESQLRSLLNEARRADPRARDIARRIQQELAPGWPADGAHGIAVFAGEDWLRLIQLPRTVEPAVRVNDVPMLEPLAEMAEPEMWAVWLVNRRAARILIGTPEQIAERIIALKAAGADLILLGFLHFQEEIEFFGKRVIPLVRELEAGGDRLSSPGFPRAAHAGAQPATIGG